MQHDHGSRMLKAAFLAVSFAVQPFLLLMLAAPRAAFTQRMVANNLVFRVLGAVYGALAMYAATRNWSLKAARAVFGLDFDKITPMMGKPSGTVTVWTHMTINDFFVARWIYFDSLKSGKPARLWILAQGYLGPIGLLGYLLSRGK